MIIFCIFFIGIINENEIVEVKCSFKLAQYGKSLMQAVQEKAVPYLEFKDGILQIKQNHDYYYAYTVLARSNFEPDLLMLK